MRSRPGRSQLSICVHDACDWGREQSGRKPGFSQLSLAEIQRLIRCGCVPCTQAMPWREHGDLLLPVCVASRLSISLHPGAAGKVIACHRPLRLCTARPLREPDHGPRHYPAVAAWQDAALCADERARGTGAALCVRVARHQPRCGDRPARSAGQADGGQGHFTAGLCAALPRHRRRGGADRVRADRGAALRHLCLLAGAQAVVARAAPRLPHLQEQERAGAGARVAGRGWMHRREAAPERELHAARILRAVPRARWTSSAA